MKTPSWIACALLACLPVVAAEPAVERLLDLGDTFLDRNSPGEALRAFEGAARVSKTACPPCERGAIRALLRLHRYDDAEERTRDALEDTPASERAALRLLHGRARLNRPGTVVDPEALAELEALFRALLSAGIEAAGLPLAETLSRLERDAEVKPTLEEYLASGPEEQGARRARELIARPHCGRVSCLPPFEAAALDGTTWNNERLMGRVVLLDFWATWCGPCKDSIPELRRIAAERGDSPFLLLSFSIDEDDAVLRKAIEEYGMSWPQIWDPAGATIRQRFGIRQFPSHVLLDHTGAVRGHYSGWREGYGERLSTKIDGLLDEASRP